jgi:hypothetical protein
MMNRSPDPLQFFAEEILGGQTAAPFSLAVAVEVLETVKTFDLDHKFGGGYFNE